MIQRIQTIWLLLAAVLMALTFQFPFYSGNMMVNNASIFKEIKAGFSFLLLFFTIALVILPIAIVLLYKTRPRQIFALLPWYALAFGFNFYLL